MQGLEVGLLIDGTDIAGAIAAGASLLKDAPHRSKVLILVTDGAHNKAGLVPALAARAAAAFDEKVFAIAIGQQPASASAGIETVLTQAARITDGHYFRAHADSGGSGHVNGSHVTPSAGVADAPTVNRKDESPDPEA